MSNETNSKDPSCEPDPEIAGLGILISFTLLAILPLIFSTVALWAPNLRKSRQGYHSASGDGPDRKPKSTLDKITESGDTMALSQVTLTIAVIVSTLITYRSKLNDPHARLAATLSMLALASATQVFIPNETRPKSRKWILVLFLGFSIMVLATTLVALRSQSLVMLAPGILLLVAATLVFLLLKKFEETWWMIILHVAITLEAIGCTLWLIVFAFQQKAADWVWEGTKMHCTMATPEENAWSFGQTVAVLMVAAPLLEFTSSMIETKAEKAEKDEHEGIELRQEQRDINGQNGA